MPNLAHLSFSGSSASHPLDRVFSAVLPQLDTLAITDDDTKISTSSMLAILIQTPRLKHLYLNILSSEMRVLKEESLVLNLQSLQFCVKPWDDLPDLLSHLSGVTQRGSSNVKIDRIFLLGWKSRWSRLPPGIEWM